MILSLSLSLFALPLLAQQKMDSLVLMNDLAALRSREMDGRVTGTPGSRQAQFYLMGRFTQSGLLGFDGNFEQPFFFSWQGRRIMGTNLIAYIPGSTDSLLCLSASYDGKDSLDNDPGKVAGICSLLSMAGYFTQHRPLHTLIIIAFDASAQFGAGWQAFIAGSPDLLKKTLLEIDLDNTLTGEDGKASSCTGSQSVSHWLEKLDANEILHQEICTDTIKQGIRQAFTQAHIPTLLIKEGKTAGFNPSSWYQFTNNLTRLVVRLDRLLAPGTRLPGEQRWIMPGSPAK